MRQNKIFRLLTALVAIGSISLGLSACGEAGASVACDEVASELKTAVKAASEAKSGTPTAKNAAKKVKDLEEVAQKCGTDERADVELASGEVVSLPVVDGEDPANPISGTESNRDPRTPPVRGDGQRKQVVASWGQLDEVRGNDSVYTKCVESRLGMNWETDVTKFAQVEKQVRPDGSRLGTRFVLAVNTTADDAKIREVALKDAPDLPADAHIVKISGFINTRGFNTGICDPFWDTRSMVRVALGVVLFNANGEAIGLDSDPKGSRAKGVFVDCHNPFELARRRPPVVTTPSTRPHVKRTPTTRPPSVTTTVTSPPRTTTTVTTPHTTTTICSSNKCTPPSTVAPPPTTARPSSPPTTQPANGGQGDSGDGATNTTTSPTTEKPAPAPPTTDSPTNNPPPPPG